MSLTYLTFLEPISGVYEGQVVDVCDHFEQTFSVETRLIAVLSRRDFGRQRDRLLSRRPDARAIWYPLGWKLWPISRRFVETLVAAHVPKDAEAILARGPLATSIALNLRRRGLTNRVAYDGRGAVAAEWSEYSVAPSAAWRDRIADVERQALLESDARIAVSKELVSHWKEVFGYSGDGHVVIPCTLSIHHGAAPPDADEIATRRRELGLTREHVVICYAGSTAEWQSIAGFDSWLDDLMNRDPRVAVLMMTEADLSTTRIVRHHGERVRQAWVAPEKVRWTMEAADYGLLIREPSVTNRVAAPTKFAEYLAAGLSVLISPEIGDYSTLALEHNLGRICFMSHPPGPLEQRSIEQRRRLSAYASSAFAKSSYNTEYRQILDALAL